MRAGTVTEVITEELTFEISLYRCSGFTYVERKRMDILSEGTSENRELLNVWGTISRWAF